MNIPDNNTDIVRCAQTIIDNYVNLHSCRFKRSRKNTVDKVLWIAAAVALVLTLSMYMLMR